LYGQAKYRNFLNVLNGALFVCLFLYYFIKDKKKKGTSLSDPFLPYLKKDRPAV